MAGGADLLAVEARLRAILAPYEERLEAATVYGIPMLRRPGAKAHQWFAFVKPASHHVGFFLLPISEYPELRAGLSPALRKRLTGKATFNFKAIDAAEMAELEALVARAYERYMAEA
ncbi:MAG: hypothetical protein AB1627_03705 [Chloroflexota bacterium]